MLIAVLLVGAVLGGLAVWAWAPPRKRLPALPAEWALVARRALSTSERRFYNQLRLAFPKYIVLPKLPLVRLCQPATPDQVKFWYELIGAAHVTFAVCNPNGHVLLVIDLDSARSHSRRSTRIKESVLAACGIQRLQFSAEALPSVDELRSHLADAAVAHPALVMADAPVPESITPPAAAALAAHAAVHTPEAAAPPLVPSGPPAVHAPTAHSAEPPGPGQDPNVFLDSFFTTDDRPGSGSASESAPEWVDWPPVSGSSKHSDGAVVNDDDADARWRHASARVAGGR